MIKKSTFIKMKTQKIIQSIKKYLFFNTHLPFYTTGEIPCHTTVARVAQRNFIYFNIYVSYRSLFVSINSVGAEWNIRKLVAIVSLYIIFCGYKRKNLVLNKRRKLFVIKLKRNFFPVYIKNQIKILWYCKKDIIESLWYRQKCTTYII